MQKNFRSKHFNVKLYFRASWKHPPLPLPPKEVFQDYADHAIYIALNRGTGVLENYRSMHVQ